MSDHSTMNHTTSTHMQMHTDDAVVSTPIYQDLDEHSISTRYNRRRSSCRRPPYAASKSIFLALFFIAVAVSSSGISAFSPSISSSCRATSSSTSMMITMDMQNTRIGKGKPLPTTRTSSSNAKYANYISPVMPVVVEIPNDETATLPRATSTIVAGSKYDTAKSQSSGNDFRRRMKNLVKRNNQQQSSNNDKPSNIVSAFTLEEYKDVLDKYSDKIVVVRFFATWCKVRYILYLLVLIWVFDLFDYWYLAPSDYIPLCSHHSSTSFTQPQTKQNIGM